MMTGTAFSRLRVAAAIGCMVFVLGCEMPKDPAESPSPPEDLGPATTGSRDPQAPDTYEVTLETTKGPVVIAVDRDLAPRGADRFYRLVKDGFYDETKFFRIVPGFVVQVGMAADPKVNAQWQDAVIRDDPVKTSNVEGTVTFANSGPNSRSAQIFINTGDNTQSLDHQGFAPFGRVISGMEAIRALNAEYGESPNQMRIAQSGNEYLESEFPNLDGIKTARVTAGGAQPASASTAETTPSDPPAESASTEPAQPAPESEPAAPEGEPAMKEGEGPAMEAKPDEPMEPAAPATPEEPKPAMEAAADAPKETEPAKETPTEPAAPEAESPSKPTVEAARPAAEPAAEEKAPEEEKADEEQPAEEAAPE